MERRVKFNTATKFELAEEEIRHFYTVMALMQYPYDCNPDYQEERLIRRLYNNFHQQNKVITMRCETSPNNFSLIQMNLFIQRHYVNLKKIVKDFSQEE